MAQIVIFGGANNNTLSSFTNIVNIAEIVNKTLENYMAMYLDMPGDSDDYGGEAQQEKAHEKEKDELYDDEELFIDDRAEDSDAENESNDAGDEHSGMEDNELVLHTEAESQTLVNDLFKITFETFGLEITKRIIFSACKQNGIGLFARKSRDAKSALDALDIEDVKLKTATFPAASADVTINLQPNDSQQHILQNCSTVNTKIVALDANKDLSCAYIFGLYYQMRQNVNAAKRLPRYKEFLPALRQQLNGTNTKKMTDARFSKHMRKYERVEQLVDAVGSRAGAFLLGMYITVYSLENDTHEDWSMLLEDLRNNLEYIAFSMIQ